MVASIFQPIHRVVDLTHGAKNRIYNMTAEDARARVAGGSPEGVLAIDGSFALVGRQGATVRMARSIDRPLRYFLAKRTEGPLLVVADRIDAIHAYLTSEGLAAQFQPSYTRMVPAHYLLEIQLVGCPDPDPTYRRFFTPTREVLPADPGEIGKRYVAAVCDEIAKWLGTVPPQEPIGVCFSGGVDSGAVLLATDYVLRRLGMSPARLKAFTLTGPGGEDLAQARRFLEKTGLAHLHEPIPADTDDLDPLRAVPIVEDYKPLDLESATMALSLCRGIRARYPEWRHLADGDGGDENLKDYPIHENPELTIVSVLNNSLLYQEGWGVGTIKHSLTYSGGQSRSYTRTYAPLQRCGFEGFSPFTRPSVIAVAEAIPFVTLTGWDPDRLYALKGEIVSRGVEAVTGTAMPVFPKRRFQEGVVGQSLTKALRGRDESAYRAAFHSLYV
jgi:asparagine synthase (glutamine-hydrolysing)